MSGLTLNQTIPVDHRMQRILTSAHTLPYIEGSTFAISLDEYMGSYHTYVGQDPLTTYHSSNDTDTIAFIDIAHNGTYATLSSSVTYSLMLMDYVNKGEFIRIQDQTFRVCLNENSTFVSTYGPPSSSGLSSDEFILLCDPEDPFVAKSFYSGPLELDLHDIVIMKLEIFVGEVISVALGDTSLRTTSDLTAWLQEGDFIRLGHPLEGETFRVGVDLGFDSSTLPLGTMDDPTKASSVSLISLQASTYEVQTINFTTSDPSYPLTSGNVSSSGYRLKFSTHTTGTTKAGGASGCLLWDGSAYAMRDELKTLTQIDDVWVTRSTAYQTVSYQITFVGDNVRGNVPSLQVIDIGTNGCNDAEDESASYVYSSYIVPKIAVSHRSVMPVYKALTTVDLPFNAQAEDVKDALNALSVVGDIHVERSVVDHGFSWIITFLAADDEPYRLMINDVLFDATINPNIEVTSMQKVPIAISKESVPYYVRVSAKNGYGSGTKAMSSPFGVGSSLQLPEEPSYVYAFTLSPNETLVSWEAPSHHGGSTIKKYKVEWDYVSTFDSSEDNEAHGLAYVDATSYQVYDVQAITLTGLEGTYPGGTFRLAFNGKETYELEYDSLDVEIEQALEDLSTINDVSVSRHLICSREIGMNQCQDPRGYTWLITFKDVTRKGDLTVRYESTFNILEGHLLSTRDDYLLDCDIGNRTACVHDASQVNMITGSRMEEQSITCYANGTYDFTFMGATRSIEFPVTLSSLEATLETIPNIGDLSIRCPACSEANDTSTKLLSCSENGSYVAYVTFEHQRGDLVTIDVSSSSSSSNASNLEIQESTKGLSQYVVGESPFSYLVSDGAFGSHSWWYVRVSAINDVGTGPSKAIHEKYMRLYETKPSMIQSLEVTPLASQGLALEWEDPVVPHSGHEIDTFVIEWDTLPSFIF
jgi:hypothetical protein